MSDSSPVVCHECWPTRPNWNQPCTHAMHVYEQGRQAGRGEAVPPPPSEPFLADAPPPVFSVPLGSEPPKAFPDWMRRDVTAAAEALRDDEPNLARSLLSIAGTLGVMGSEPSAAAIMAYWRAWSLTPLAAGERDRPRRAPSRTSGCLRGGRAPRPHTGDPEMSEQERYPRDVTAPGPTQQTNVIEGGHDGRCWACGQVVNRLVAHLCRDVQALGAWYVSY